MANQTAIDSSEIKEELENATIKHLQRTKPTLAPFKLTNDALNMTHRGHAARVAFKAIDMVHGERPEAQVHGAALLFLALCERNRVNARDCLIRAERILAARHDVSERRANQWFAALADYIDHLYDPKRGHPTG